METMAAPKATAHEFTRTPAFEALARAGYVARGAIYMVIGLLAIRLAEGFGNAAPASQQGALRTIAHQRYGNALLLVVAIGLGGYSLWRLTQALLGWTPEAGKHSTLDRVGAAGSGLAYGGLCLLSVGLLLGSPAAAGSGNAKKTTADVFGWPAGRALVAVAGIVFLVIAAYQIYQAVSRRFLDDSKVAEMGEGVRKAFTFLGISGLLARGVAFGLIGSFVLRAAIDYNAKQAAGLDGALARLPTHTYGTASLYIVAAGLIAFGIYSLADARYRKI